MNYRLWIRIAFGYLSFTCLQIGIWGLLAPRSFYDTFPGFSGRTWIAVDGPYNEHLIRDVGALNLALLVVLLGAAISLSRPLVFTACAAAATWGVPHFVYHALNPDGLATSDLAFSLSGLATFAGLPLVITWLTHSKLEPQPN